MIHLLDGKMAVKHKILLALDRRQYHGYSLYKLLTVEFQSLPRASFYRWLNEMEDEGLIASSIEPGPHGPERKVYSLGEEGESYLRQSLKNAIETIIHFYNGFRYSRVGNMDPFIQRADPPNVDGRILFVAFSPLSDQDISIVDTIAKRRDGKPIDVYCDTTLLGDTHIPFRTMKGSIENVPIGDSAFAEIWFLGTPRREIITQAILESKRLLKKDGMLRIIAPFVFFDPPKEPTLTEFIRVTAIHLFPELGFAEGEEIGRIIEAYFQDCGAIEAFPGFILFWAKKN